PLADRGRDRSLEGDLVTPDRLEQLDGQWLSAPLEGDDTRVVRLPVDRHAGNLQDAEDGLADFGADPVAGDERDSMGHGVLRVETIIGRLACPSRRARCRPSPSLP